ncbi:MAG: hypothetical protein R3B72_23530 [Polyangiaceae bacterium]
MIGVKRLGVALLLASFAGAVAHVSGCSAASSNSDGPSGSGAGSGAGAGSGTGAGSGVGGLSGFGGNGSGGDDACVATSAEATNGPLPADIIFVVDNSGSMGDEAGFVQNSMNDFSNIMVNSGIDYRVILISADSNDDHGICVPAPLGGGACPADDNPPNYFHIPTTVGSSNALQLILSEYPNYQQHLRLGATKTITVVTDDDSALSATDFTSQLLALDPTFQDFVFHGIIAPYELDPFKTLQCASTQPPNCGNVDVCCGVNTTVGFFCAPLPADEGKVYKDLIAATGGMEGNLCSQNFVPVFQQIATAVVATAQVPCVYDIPTPPDNSTIDYDKVNVDYTPDSSAPSQSILHVPGGLPDCGTDGGWYYDDDTNPTKIILCPTTCTEVQTGNMPKVEVKFGCATQIK